MGDMLVPYNFPLGDPNVEDDINPLKTTEVVVDGYPIVVHYSKADYGSHYLITFQVLGQNAPFLPFNVVVKLAKKFLGSKDLSLVELLKDNRKIYCWTVTMTKEGESMLLLQDEEDSEHCIYEGFEYVYMRPDKVSFY
jgi:hypothetical protein